MNNNEKNEGAVNALHSNLTQPYAKDIMLLNELQVLRDMAWQYAIKYRFDPILSQTHGRYLRLLIEILEVSDET